MKLSVPKERRRDERRVAVSPDTAKKLVGLGFQVVVETGAGRESGFDDSAYEEAGAAIAADGAETLSGGDVVLKVQRPLIETEKGGDELTLMKKGAVVIGALGALQHADHAAAYARAGLTAFSLELLPRITRAQSMDILSSQSNIAGYKAVLDGAGAFGRALPMMMTAAGTIPPARVLVLGAGVAGLQAIATAKRLGAIVTGYDVRPVVKEQVESLGAKFLAVDQDAAADAETTGGYAREMGASYKEREAEVLGGALAKNDIVICTALIPGRPAPVLIDADMVSAMRPGSVIVDLAVEQGGNCELSRCGEVVERHRVTIIGHANMPSRLAENASSMYARNLLNFLTPFVEPENAALAIDWDDEIVAACLLTRDGRIVHPALVPEPADKDVA